MTTPFKIRIELKTPFHMGHRITLDGLLSAAVFNATGTIGPDNEAQIPLEREGEVFKGSSLFVSGSYRHSKVGRLMALRGESDLNENAFFPNSRGQKYVYIDQARGDYKNNLSAYQAIQAREVVFFGVGDPERCQYLIENFVMGIGKRCNAGAGQIGEVAWEYSEDFSLMGEDGAPNRPLPVSLWESLGGGDYPIGKIPVQAPYWESAAVDAVFPVELCCPQV
jgi:CRISPR type IV-associated protein Csf3